MTLNTTNFKKYGARLYRQLSQNRYLEPDACADAFEMFMQRMRAYRDGHPGVERVPEAFVKKCERWIRTDLVRRSRARRVKRAVELELAKRTHDHEGRTSGAGDGALLLRLEGLFRRWTSETPKTAGNIRIFLLHHACSLGPESVRRLAEFAGGKKSGFIRDVKRVKKHVAAHSAARAAERLKAAQYWYAKSVHASLAAEEVTGKKRAAALSRLKEYEARHRRALERLGHVTCRPTNEALAEISGVSVDTVSRALRRCENEVKARLRETAPSPKKRP